MSKEEKPPKLKSKTREELIEKFMEEVSRVKPAFEVLKVVPTIPEIRRIMIIISDFEKHNNAILAGEFLAKKFNAQISVISLIDAVREKPEDLPELVAKTKNEIHRAAKHIVVEGISLSGEAVKEGVVSEKLTEAIEEEEAELVVVPKHYGETMPPKEEIRLGMVTEHLLWKVQLPVMIVEEGIEISEEMFNRVVVLIKGTEKKLDNLGYGVALAKPDGKIYLLSVINAEEVQLRAEASGKSMADVADELKKSREELLAVAAKNIRNIGIKDVEIRVKVGSPIEEILKELKSIGGIIIVNKAAEEIDKLGRVAEYIVRKCNLVLLVPTR